MRALALPETETGYMKFCDKLIALRKEKGYSQEQLAAMLGVSRQSVSKWEADASMPELSKILQLSELFMVTTDYLLKDEQKERQPIQESAQESLNGLSQTQDRILKKLEKMEEKERETVKEYEYISEKMLFGLPLVHIHFKWTKGYRTGLFVQVPGAYADLGTKAKGIIAIGNHAAGVLSIGFLAKGLISVGLFSIGLFSFGVLCLGLMALGVMAFGGLAAGIVAIGYIAMGVSAIGIYGTGVAVVAGKAATGVSAVAHTAVGSKDADGTHVLIRDVLTEGQEAASFLMEHQPDMPGWILFLLTRVR